jgi:periplasmic divalent cation tolerance protein
MTDKRIVFSTAGSEREARAIALELVERRLAACVNVTGPITSTYVWEAQVKIEDEWLLIIKTSAEQFASVSRAIMELHSYDVPECVSVEIAEGSREYLDWITQSLTGAEGEES